MTNESSPCYCCRTLKNRSSARILGVIAIAGLVLACTAPMSYGQCGGQMTATPNPGSGLVVGQNTNISVVFGPLGQDATIASVLLTLHCNNAGGCSLPCTSSGTVLQYRGDSFISANSCSPGIVSDHPGGSGADNQVVFTFVNGSNVPTPINLAAGATCTFTVGVHIAALDNDASPKIITGTAATQGECANTLPLAACGSYLIGLVVPGIHIEKSAQPTSACQGETITYSYLVTNTGDVPLSNIVVTDDNGTPGNPGDDFHPAPVLNGAFNIGDVNTNNLLDLTETWQYTHAATPGVGTIVNIAVATGDYVNAAGTTTVNDDDNETVNIKPHPPCTITGGVESLCTGATTEWCGPAGMDSYSWTGPGGFTATTQCITIGTAGQYCLVTTLNGCTSTDTCCRTLSVNDHPPCTIGGGVETICAGGSTQWCGPAGMTTYAWTGPGGFTASTQCITIGTAGQYCLVTTLNGCTSTDTCCRTLSVNPPPPCTITGGVTTICQGGSTQWCGPTDMTSYAWTGPNGFTATTQCITIGTGGQYCLVTTQNGCTSTDTCCRTLTVNPPPPCTITGNESICTGTTTEWCGPASMDTYAWTGPNGFTASTRCITIGTAGQYCLVTTKNGCTSTDECCKTLTVHDCAPPGCRFTGGGNKVVIDGVNKITFGGQAGAALTGCCGDNGGDDTQPWGEWTHQQHSGTLGDFTFHGGTASSPDATLITCIRCMDPVSCHPANNPASFKQLEFDGVGSIKAIKVAPPGSGFVKNGLYAFEVHIDDLGEPGGSNGAGDPPDGCPADGVSFPADFDHCVCPDYYRIRIHADCSITSPVVYEVFGYTDGGNFQIHEPTGSHKKSRCLQQTCGKASGASADLTNGSTEGMVVPSNNLCGATSAAALAPVMLLGWGWVRRNSRRRD